MIETRSSKILLKSFYGNYSDLFIKKKHFMIFRDYIIKGYEPIYAADVHIDMEK